MSYEPLHHKYRPQRFTDLVGQDAIATTLSNALRTERIAPAYLFAGPRGTGKTSSARILAKSLNCLQSDCPTEQPCGVCEVCRAIAKGVALDVIEIDAASNTGVDNIRELIEKAQFAPVQCRYKVYVIDECHMLSVAAFNALLKTLEEPPNRVVFVLATTDPQRVLPTIISRCQRFDFRRIPLEAMVSHLQAIAAQENINIAQDAVQALAQIAQGGLRDAESLLDQLSLLPHQITVERVWDLVGMVPERDLMALLEAIVNHNPEAVLDQARHLMDRGHEPLAVLHNLAGFYRDLLIAKTASTRTDLVTITPPTWVKLCDFAQAIDISVILTGQQHLRSCETQVKNTTQPRLWLEVTLLGLLPTQDSDQPVRRVFQSTHAATGNQPLGQLQPSALQLKQSTSATTTLPPIVEPSNPEAVPVNTSTNGTAQDQSQPQKVEAFIPHEEHADDSEPLPDPQEISATVDALPISDPEPSQATVDSQSDEDWRLNTAPQADASPTAVEPDLDQIWRNVIAHLRPMSTQALLDQLCHLIAFNGQQACVGIRSQSWLKTAQEKLPNIEAAFQAVFEHNVRVKVEVATTKPKTTLRNEQKPTIAQDSLTASTHVTRPASNNSAVLSPSPTASSNSQPRSQPRMSGPSVSPSVETIQPLQPTTNGLPQTSNSSAAHLHQAAKPAPWQEDDEATRSAKSLAQFFNGEVVSQENELVPGSIPSSDALSSEQSLMDLTEDDTAKPNEEDEIPF